ncbi:hypothetical protein BKA08_002293 [Nocardioides marinisabuli]|uniref:DUF385 domain-containing protein n=1 Tax=Nocardioides marinisabuli TaxID=419476 RepID=A0A7Y9F3H1_9ACTN|nr:hypothetical protein [Nocardioides marinisabuli]NYD58055.1 hypothetical protein [Nocardioides marinisabuli]
MRAQTADLRPRPTSRSADRPGLGVWVAALSLAEAVGLAAAAGASRLVGSWSAEPGVRGSLGFGLLLVVGAGLVEGLALGSAQAWNLGCWLPRLRRARFVAATVLVAGLGWAAGAAPGVLGQEAGEAVGSPSPVVLLLAAVGVGVVLGPLLGLAQASALRPAVGHPGAWVLASALAWPPVMVAIFAGASLPGQDWSPAEVVGAGAATGAVAGGLLGLATYWALGSMTGVPLWDRVLLRLLGSSWGWLDGDLVGVEVRGRRTGRTHQVPVRYAVDLEGALVVVPRDGTSWWCNVHRPTAAVEVLWQGEWLPAYAEPLVPGHPDHEEAWATYSLRWPRAHLPANGVVVRVWGSGGNAA